MLARGAPRPARRAALLAPCERGVCRRVRRDRRHAARMTAEHERRSTGTASAPRCCCTIQRSSSDPTFSTGSSPLPRFRSRWRGFGSRFASSSPRFRPLASGSWKPATKSAAVSSATSTTARSSGSSRSASSSGRMQRTLPREARDPLPRSRQDRRRGRCGDRRPPPDRCWRPARPGSTTASSAALRTTSPAPRQSRSTSTRRSAVSLASVEAAAYFVACEALTNAVKYALSLASCAACGAARTARCSSASPTTASGVRLPGAVPGSPGCKDRVAAHGGTLEIASPRGGGTHVEVAIPCGS